MSTTRGVVAIDERFDKSRPVAVLAYLFPPLTGLAVYLTASSPRERFHGLQAIALGLLAAATLYLASAISSGLTPFAFGFWLVVWIFLVVASLMGKDPRIPVIGGLLKRAALDDPKRQPGA
jgi:uncharacterized membrane protein